MMLSIKKLVSPYSQFKLPIESQISADGVPERLAVE